MKLVNEIYPKSLEERQAHMRSLVKKRDEILSRLTPQLQKALCSKTGLKFKEEI